MPHPDAADPRSTHFVRDHPRRLRRAPDKLQPEDKHLHLRKVMACVWPLDASSRGGIGFGSQVAPHNFGYLAAAMYCSHPASVDYPGFTHAGHDPPDAPVEPDSYVCPRIAAYESQTTVADHSVTPSLMRRLVDGDDSTSALADLLAESTAAFSVTITKDMGDLTVPTSYRKALSSPQSTYWIAAIAKEIAGLVTLHTWDLVLRSSMPNHANLMNCHFVFTVKRLADGSIDKFKARLVADGNTQKHGVDFDRVFATVVKTMTIRLVLILAAAHDYNLSSIDIRQAYLQAELTEDLWMRMPPGLPNGHTYVCKLRRSLYGLKQAGRAWATLFADFLTGWGMHRSVIDTCLYTYVDAHGALLWILLYVDDALIVDNDPPLRERFVSDLSRRFPTEDKGELHWILNVCITRDRAARSLEMSQELYLNDLLSKYDAMLGKSTTRTFDTPLEDGADLSPSHSPALDSDEYANLAPSREMYMSVVGGLLWLANMTRPDIAYAASQLSRVLSNPGTVHIQAVVRVLLYLRHTSTRTLSFATNRSRACETFVDSSWSTKFSCSGAMMFMHGCIFHWFSKIQRSVTLSSAEAEFFGAMMAARDLIFVKDILVDLGFIPDGALVIFCDSVSAVAMSFDPVAFKKTKHILRAAEFLRDLVLRNSVVLRHVAGVTMLADLLTKAVSRPIFLKLIGLLDNYAQSGQAVPALS